MLSADHTRTHDLPGKSGSAGFLDFLSRSLFSRDRLKLSVSLLTPSNCVWIIFVGLGISWDNLGYTARERFPMPMFSQDSMLKGLNMNSVLFLIVCITKLDSILCRNCFMWYQIQCMFLVESVSGASCRLLSRGRNVKWKSLVCHEQQRRYRQRQWRQSWDNSA